MPATSKKQKTLMCIALSMKRGKTPKSYSKQAAKMAETFGGVVVVGGWEGPVKEG